MPIAAWFTLAVLVVLIVVLAREILPPAVAVLSATVVLLLARIIDADAAFVGFSNEAPIIVASLLVFARAADVAGIVGPALERVFGAASGGSRWALPRLTLPIAGLSAFLNNTTVVAMTVPAVLELCRRRGLSASRFLIPISFAAVLGGVITTVGTSTNLTVSGLLRNADMQPLSLFELTPVGLPIALAGCAMIVLLAGRVLPDRRSSDREAPGDDARSFTVSMRVQRGGPIDGKTVEDAGLRHLQGVFLVEIAPGWEPDRAGWSRRAAGRRRRPDLCRAGRRGRGSPPHARAWSRRPPARSGSWPAGARHSTKRSSAASSST